MHNAINVIATIGEFGLYFREKEVKTISLNNQPNNVKPDKIIIRNKGNSFLFNILKRVDIGEFIVAVIR
jgi:hypothetical protein